MSVPSVLTFSGLDPSGGAGIAADVRALSGAGAHCLPVITALTVQNTHDATTVTAVAPELLRAQVDALLADVRPAAVKIGLLPDAATLQVVRDACARLPGIPVVADPVLRAGGGGTLVQAGLVQAWRTELLPLVTLATPNADEFEQLFPGGDVTALKTAQRLLVTGADRGTDPVLHRLVAPSGPVRSFAVERLPHTYHGSGCTLAAAIAGRLARGADVEDAISGALEQTLRALREAFQPGGGQWLPR